MIKLPFGKHKGKTLDSVPESYLYWILDQPAMSRTLKMAIMDFLGIENCKFFIDRNFAATCLRSEMKDLKSQYLNNAEANQLIDEVQARLTGWLTCVEHTEKDYLELVAS